MAKHSICTTCGYVGYPQRITRGSFYIELALWLLFILPGLIYTIWRLTSQYEICPECRNTSMIPVDTPRGQRLLEIIQEYTASSNSNKK
ncbi:MAG TPA: hypothetical protein PLX23_00570 [Candidatus Hydrogenedens sp.]|nr:hypothetical protein [Candidatus Hydrogenedens sp.]